MLYSWQYRKLRWMGRAENRDSGPIVPDGRQVGRQGGDFPQIELALFRAVEVRSARRQKAIMAGNLRILGILVRRMAAGHDLDGRAPQCLELIEQGVKLQGR